MPAVPPPPIWNPPPFHNCRRAPRATHRVAIVAAGPSRRGSTSCSTHHLNIRNRPARGRGGGAGEPTRHGVPGESVPPWPTLDRHRGRSVPHHLSRLGCPIALRDCVHARSRYYTMVHASGIHLRPDPGASSHLSIPGYAAAAAGRFTGDTPSTRARPRLPVSVQIYSPWNARKARKLV